MSIIKESIIRHGHGPLNPSYFCVHSTANIGATAKNHVDYWAANDVPCTHLVSDWTEAYHTVPYDELCWQVGNGNAYVEGLEICEATNADDFRRSIEIAEKGSPRTVGESTGSYATPKQAKDGEAATTLTPSHIFPGSVTPGNNSKN